MRVFVPWWGWLTFFGLMQLRIVDVSTSVTSSDVAQFLEKKEIVHVSNAGLGLKHVFKAQKKQLRIPWNLRSQEGPFFERCQKSREISPPEVLR